MGVAGKCLAALTDKANFHAAGKLIRTVESEKDARKCFSTLHVRAEFFNYLLHRDLRVLRCGKLPPSDFVGAGAKSVLSDCCKGLDLETDGAQLKELDAWLQSHLPKNGLPTSARGWDTCLTQHQCCEKRRWSERIEAGVGKRRCRDNDPSSVELRQNIRAECVGLCYRELGFTKRQEPTLPEGLAALNVKAMGFKREMFGCLAGEDPLLGHVASSASTMLSLTTAGLAGQGALGGPSPRPGSARSARSVKSTAMDDPNALWRLTRRLQYRARPSRALEDLRRVRVLLDVDDGPLPFGVQSLESTSPEEFEEASAAAKERRLLLAGLVLAAADLAFLALPQRLHQAWAELAADERELGMAARQWLRGLAETLAIPLYDTLRTLEE
ncbi:unnamed protein product, partial [Effrenium voratum]